MKMQELLIFGAIIAVVLWVLVGSAGSAGAGFKFNGKTIKYDAGSDFVLTLDASATLAGAKDVNLCTSQSTAYPCSEPFEDTNNDKVYTEGVDRFDLQKHDLNKDGEWTPILMDFKWTKQGEYSYADGKKKGIPLDQYVDSSTPWKLDYRGTDEGKLVINLEVIDYHAQALNGSAETVTDTKQWIFNCIKRNIDGPEIKLAVDVDAVEGSVWDLNQQ